MSELIDKLSSYNLFNYLLPGTVFVFLVEAMTSHSLVHDNLIVAAFMFYFIGLIISRIGSIFIEPALKIISKHVTYKDYIKASDEDDMIKILSEQNNVYRTAIAMLLAVFMMLFYDYIALRYPDFTMMFQLIVLALMTLLFVLAYRKQTKYIVMRVEARLDKSSDH